RGNRNSERKQGASSSVRMMRSGQNRMLVHDAPIVKLPGTRSAAYQRSLVDCTENVSDCAAKEGGSKQDVGLGSALLPSSIGERQNLADDFEFGAEWAPACELERTLIGLAAAQAHAELSGFEHALAAFIDERLVTSRQFEAHLAGLSRLQRDAPKSSQAMSRNSTRSV